MHNRTMTYVEVIFKNMYVHFLSYLSLFNIRLTNHTLTTVDTPYTKDVYHAYFPVDNSFITNMDMFLKKSFKTGFSLVMTEQS
jgi:hypothetical protein